MATNNHEISEQQRRRQRINRMKTGIILTIAIWMLVSFLAIVVLSVLVIRLNIQINDMVKTESVLPGNNSEVDSSNSGSSESNPNRFDNIVTGIDTEDNFATTGDVHNVYLTFNSVPGDNTKAILDVLAQYNVKATFFVVGSEEEGVAEIYQRIVNEGHTIGMHSYSNKYSSVYSSTNAFKQDYQKLSDYIYASTGVRSAYYRFPGSSGNDISNISMAEFVYILNQEGITYFDWNVSAGDAVNGYTVQEVLEQVLTGVSKYKTSVVLLHDNENKSTTVEALGTLITQLQSQGANILPIDEDTYKIQYIKAESVK